MNTDAFTKSPSGGGNLWRMVWDRTWPFVVGGTYGLVLSMGLGILLGSLIDGDRGSVWKGVPVSLVPRLVVTSLAAALFSVAGVYAAEWWDRRRREGGGETDRFCGYLGAIAASQKVLLIALLICPFLGYGAARWLSVPYLYWVSPVVGIYLMTLALGYPLRERLVWLVVCGGMIGLLRLLGFLFSSAEGVEPVFFVLIRFPAAVLGLTMVLVLNHRATRALRRAGVKPGFFGVPFRDFPAMADGEGELTEISQSEAVQKEEAGTSMDAEPQVERRLEGQETLFFYLGPENEPIGPMPWRVMSQLWESGVLNDETLIAPAGGEAWETYATRRADSGPPESLREASGRNASINQATVRGGAPGSNHVDSRNGKPLLVWVSFGLALLILVFAVIPKGGTDPSPRSGGLNPTVSSEQELGAAMEWLGSLPIPCPQCGGSGRKVLRGFCDGCRGKGTVLTPSGYVIVCSQCGGSGEGVFPCDVCKGTGKTRRRF
ncbi:MAG: hypothetical protein KDM64_05825 [Verrucomicrobiae bacterium]|nr:hypothetical protein [Verrucomicrobiae bacterium]